MKIDQWMNATDTSNTDLSRVIKRHVSRIGRHLNHGTRLDHETIRRIYFASRGAVQPNDFFDLENCPEDLREHFYGKDKA